MGGYEQKANINVIGAKNGFTPLHAAIYFHNVEIAKILIQNKAIIKKDFTNKTPLDIAKERKMSEIIQLLDTQSQSSKIINTNIISENLKPMETLNDLDNRLNALLERNRLFNDKKLLQEKPKLQKKIVPLDNITKKINTMKSNIDKLANTGEKGKIIFTMNHTKLEQKYDYDKFENNIKTLSDTLEKIKLFFDQEEKVKELHGSDVSAIMQRNAMINMLSHINGCSTNMHHDIEFQIIPTDLTYEIYYEKICLELGDLIRLSKKLINYVEKIRHNLIEIGCDKRRAPLNKGAVVNYNNQL